MNKMNHSARKAKQTKVSKLRLDIVPWFSRQEWHEVYRAAYSQDVNKWREAFHTMLVWQARVRKLAIGISVTIPLLQAKIMDTDLTLDRAVKSQFNAVAITKFVTSLLKIPQDNYYRTQPLSQLAYDLGLPLYLVDLRNEINHGLHTWSGSQTLHLAVDTCYQWIKGYYWDKEVKQIDRRKLTRRNLTLHVWFMAREQLKLYAQNYFSKTLCVEESTTDKLLKLIKKIYHDNPEEAIDTIVSCLILPENVKDIEKRLLCETNCSCGFFFPTKMLREMDSILQALQQIDGAMEHLFSYSVMRSKGVEIYTSEWLTVVAESLIRKSDPEKSCTNIDEHRFYLDTTIPVRWRSVVKKLLGAEISWAADLAFRIMHIPETGFLESEIEKIKQLQSIKGNAETDSAQITDDNTDNPECFSVSDVIQNSLIQEQENGLKEVPDHFGTEDEFTPLGILPHQRDNPFFYKDLLLHYPETVEGPLVGANDRTCTSPGPPGGANDRTCTSPGPLVGANDRTCTLPEDEDWSQEDDL